MSSIKELVLVVSLNGSKFAIDVDSLVEVSEGLDVSYGDDVEGFLGKVRFRGDEIKLFDIQRRLGLKGNSSKSLNFVIVNSGNEIVAFPVDSVEGVIAIKGNALPFPGFMLSEEGLFPYVYNWDGEFVLSVNIASLLNFSYLAS